MKIAMLYASWEKFGEPWSTPRGIQNEFESRGYDVRQYNLYHDDGALSPQTNIRRYSNQGINLLLNDMRLDIFKPDLVLCMDYGPWDAVQFDKRILQGAIVLKEAGDEPQSHRQHWPASDRVHAILSPDKECVERYKSMSRRAIYWTHHADLRVFYPRDEVDIVFDCVTTCGSRGGGLTDEIKLALGNQFNNERYFHGDKHAERLNMGKMVFQCSQFKEVTRRIFEGMACGKMVITDRLPDATGLSEMFIEGQDIVYYDDAKDAIDKIRYYANHDQEREEIAFNGFQKVMRSHTQVHRCDAIEALVEEIKGVVNI
jgi:hypothetical protein